MRTFTRQKSIFKAKSASCTLYGGRIANYFRIYVRSQLRVNSKALNRLLFYEKPVISADSYAEHEALTYGPGFITNQTNGTIKCAYPRVFTFTAKCVQETARA